MSTVLDKPADTAIPKLDVEEMLERHRVASDHWADHRKRFKKNIAMYTGDQWDGEAKKERKKLFRPCITVNMLRQPISQIVNDARSNRIGPKITPVDGRADKDMAQVFADLIRGIDHQSRAHIADEYALEMAAAGGYGFIRVTWEYASATSLDKRLVIERIPDPERVLIDPFAIDPDASDMEYGFIDHFFSKSYFKRRWKKKEMVDAVMAGEDQLSDWNRANGVLVAEYWTKHYGKDYTMFRFADGTEVRGRDAMEATRDMMGEEPMDDRKCRECTIWQHWTNGKEDLEEPSEWPDDLYIPIIPVWGNELWVDGKRTFRAVIEDSHEPQEYLNYMVTKAAEIASQAPMAPYHVAEGAVNTVDFPEWKTANTQPHQFLRHHAFDAEGRQMPTPERDQYQLAIQGYSMLTEQAKTFLDSTHGIQRTARGETDPSVKSARMSQSLTRESDMSSFHIHDNLARAVQHRYRIMVRVAPRLMDVAKWIRIIGEDNAEQAVQVFQAVAEQTGGYAGPAIRFQKKNADSGAMEEAVAPLDPEMYDVRVDTGPSLTTRRAEAAMQTLELAKILPIVAQAAPHKIIRNLDIPGKDEIADAVEKALPPALQEKKEGEPQIPPEIQQQMQQMTQLIETAKKEIEQLKFEKAAKVAELEGRSKIEGAKIASDERMTKLEQQVKVMIAKMDAEQENDKLTSEEQQHLMTMRRDREMSQQESVEK